jgi:AraC family transcriptional regulator
MTVKPPVTPQPQARPSRDGAAPGATSSRRLVLDVPVALVEDQRAASGSRQPGPEGFSPEFQVVFPYRGMLLWHVGRDQVVGDANQVLFVTGGEAYRVSQPLGSGYAELIVTPSIEVLSELAHRTGAPVAAHPLFRRRSQRATPRLQSFAARFLSWTHDADASDPLAAEELVLALLRAALDEEAIGGEPNGSTQRLIRRTKAFLEAELANPIKLADMSRAVGASPAYLTHVFRRVEGISLHRYLVQLRLARALVELPRVDDLTTARALVELPRVDDLTTLAVDIGFSSHSHFTAAFRRAFGTTPSEFRTISRKRVRPPPP